MIQRQQEGNSHTGHSWSIYETPKPVHTVTHVCQPSHIYPNKVTLPNSAIPYRSNIQMYESVEAVPVKPSVSVFLCISFQHLNMAQYVCRVCYIRNGKLHCVFFFISASRVILLMLLLTKIDWKNYDIVSTIVYNIL